MEIKDIKNLNLEKGLFVCLSSNPYDSRVFVDGKMLENVTKVEIGATPDSTKIVLHCIDAKVYIDDIDYGEFLLKTKELNVGELPKKEITLIDTAFENRDIKE